MKISHHAQYGLLAMLLCSFSSTADTTLLPAGSEAECLPERMCYRLSLASFEHIEFGRIPANKVSIEADAITLDVMNSASLLMQSFDDVLSVQHVSLTWKSNGKPAIPSANSEKEKGGDDAVIKLGLLLRADKKPFKPFLPAWMEKVEASLKYPSTEMIYVVADSMNESGERWLSPYNDRVTMVSMQDDMSEDGWYHSKLDFDEPLEVVAVWLMSDGDDTNSSFTTWVKDIVMK